MHFIVSLRSRLIFWSGLKEPFLVYNWSLCLNRRFWLRITFSCMFWFSSFFFPNSGNAAIETLLKGSRGTTAWVWNSVYVYSCSVTCAWSYTCSPTTVQRWISDEHLTSVASSWLSTNKTPCSCFPKEHLTVAFSLIQCSPCLSV